MGRNAVVGIDAAWTAGQKSGVAVAVESEGGWRLSAVAGSYGQFIELAPGAGSVIEAATAIAGVRPSLVAVDMPLSHDLIVSRRVADNAVSKAYGGRHCSTHTPNPDRPGKVGRLLQERLASEGYGLATTELAQECTIEVYPHPALLSLTGAAQRMPYKIQKIRDYWPTADRTERLSRILAVWAEILEHLDRRIPGTAEALPLPEPSATTAALKSYEDQLDAVICAWVGIEALEGRVEPFGDDQAAIWIPNLSR